MNEEIGKEVYRTAFVPAEVPAERIENAILLLHGQRVILDRDIAALYGVPTKVLKQAVKRNADRFPDDFMFVLDAEEFETWRSQFVTSSSDQKTLPYDLESENLRSQIVTSSSWGGDRYAPMAFTEQGVAMLSSVLRSPRAVQVNIAIMRAFVRLRETLSLHKELAHKLADLERRIEDHDEGIHRLFEAIRQLAPPPPVPSKRPIGFRIQEKPAVYRARKRRGRA